MTIRVVTIENKRQARSLLATLGCDPAGVAIMADKAVFRTLLIEEIPTKDANLLKQTFLAKGGEVALTRGSADMSVSHTNALVCATLKQYRLAIAQLKLQPWGLPELAAALETVLQGQENFPLRQYQWPDQQLQILPNKTLIMGILNVTPDSFSDGGRYTDTEIAVQHAREMVGEGAHILDIGAESTRPYGGAQPVDAAEELRRLLPVVDALLPLRLAPLSIDTYKAEVAEVVLTRGAHIINDIGGLQKDPEMAAVVAKHQVPLVVMHNEDLIHSSQDILSAMVRFLERSIAIGLAAGIQPECFILDPGLGFGKTPVQNLEIMSRLEELTSLGYPLLLASSRKRFIGEVLNLPVEDRIEGTGATVALGIMKGVQMVRVHDVQPMARVAAMIDSMKRSG